MAIRSFLPLAALALLTVLVLPAGPAAAAPGEASSNAQSNPCEGWNPTPTAKWTGDECLFVVVVPAQDCPGPWYHTEEGNVGPVGYQRTVCDGGVTSATQCEPLNTGTPADGVCIHIENNPPNCVGPWTGKSTGSVGPVSWTIHYCRPPGGGPTLT